MFVLDTNVVSELMRPAPEPAIEAWLTDRPTSSLFITAISEAELRFGVAVMPPGKRRDLLAAGLERMLTTGFADRVLPFDSAAARIYADMAAARRAAGRPISQADCQIAAIARPGGGDTQRAGLPGYRREPRRSLEPHPGRRLSAHAPGLTDARSTRPGTSSAPDPTPTIHDTIPVSRDPR